MRCVRRSNDGDLILEQWRRERPNLDPSPNGPPYQLRPSEFSSARMLTSSGTTKRLDRLEQAGLITRAPDPQDRRRVVIALTPAGLKLIDAATEAHLENERRLLAGLSQADQRRLADLLRKLQLGLAREE